MTPFASLPMYNFPEMRSANAQFWGALRGLLLEAGLSDVPETLVFERAFAGAPGSGDVVLADLRFSTRNSV
jgi:hypothetical protein